MLYAGDSPIPGLTAPGLVMWTTIPGSGYGFKAGKGKA